MSHVHTLFDKNFLEYASYVIKDRAIPHLEDGLKPVQRRILHSLIEIDDGKFHKVANVAGHAMKYHPHGDASIVDALVVLANKELFVDTQGNFGNVLTGDAASAARYIECRIDPIAYELLYRKELTAFTDSYDSRNKEPVLFPAKVPLVLVLGAEGIAVGMSTRILPHNFREVLEAVAARLRGEAVELYPDVVTGGLMDVSEYARGMGRVRVRAKLDTGDPKRVVIRELPFGSTTESLINSIDQAARRGKVKVAQINDFTTEAVEIELKLPRGVYADDVVDALYAFTDCEQSISCNLLVIDGEKPRLIPVDEVIAHHATRLVELLTRELEFERGELTDKLHARTLERIFVEQRIYQRIETETDAAGVRATVIAGFEPFKNELIGPVEDHDVERLLEIPIRRISRYDIERAKQQMQAINARLAQIEALLADTTGYAIAFLDGIIERHGDRFVRRTRITSFDKVDVRDAATRDLTLRLDRDAGYLGYALSGGEHLGNVSRYDRVLVIDAAATYRVIDVPEKVYVGKAVLWAGPADKERLAEQVFSLVYVTDDEIAYIKRFKIEQFILDKVYELIPPGAQAAELSTNPKAAVRLRYKKKPRMHKTSEDFAVSDYLVKSARAGGVRLSAKEAAGVRLLAKMPGKG